MGDEPMTSADESLIDLARVSSFTLGPLEVRPPSRQVVLGERRDVVEPRVMQVLVALARRRGEVVSRDDLIAAAWGGRVVGEDAINRAIAGVRRLGLSSGAFTVETVARVGYRMNEAGAAPAGRSRRRRVVWSIGLAAAAAVLVVAGALGLRRPPSP